MNLLDRLDGVQVINSRVKANLVHDCDSGVLGSLIELQHSWGDIAGCDDVLLVADRRLDDLCVEDVWDEGDDKVVLSHDGVECSCVVDVDGDSLGVLDAFGELLRALEGTAS